MKFILVVKKMFRKLGIKRKYCINGWCFN